MEINSFRVKLGYGREIGRGAFNRVGREGWFRGFKLRWEGREGPAARRRFGFLGKAPKWCSRL